MSDIHALSGAYALDALDDTERAEFEQHLAECAECRAEVASFRETTAVMAESETETPPPSLRRSVLAGISQVRPLPPETPAQPPTDIADRRGVVRRRRWPQVLGAAAAVVLLAVGLFAWHPWQHDTTSVADQILHAPDAVSVTEQVPGGGEFVLTRSPSIGMAVMVGHDVPSAGAGKTYQMWLQQPGQAMASAGLLPNADQPTVLDGDAGTATAAAVSVEPEGGSVHPSKDVVAVFSLQPKSGQSAGT
jgi:anti-sigma-K factor RskA